MTGAIIIIVAGIVAYLAIYWVICKPIEDMYKRQREQQHEHDEELRRKFFAKLRYTRNVTHDWEALEQWKRDHDFYYDGPKQ